MAASASLSSMDRHQPVLGLTVLVEATHFGERVGKSRVWQGVEHQEVVMYCR